jgi:hypothetical protein
VDAVTDSKTVVEDLAAWLTAVWDEEERAMLAGRDEREITFLRDDHGGPRPDDEYLAVHVGAGWVLARIAADRKILEIHSPDPREPEVCTTCGEPLEYTVSWPCETARVLASPHADRPGFRSEWLVERQGVEQ